jgi:hypothetical protein
MNDRGGRGLTRRLRVGGGRACVHSSSPAQYTYELQARGRALNVQAGLPPGRALPVSEAADCVFSRLRLDRPRQKSTGWPLRNKLLIDLPRRRRAPCASKSAPHRAKCALPAAHQLPSSARAGDQPRARPAVFPTQARSNTRITYQSASQRSYLYLVPRRRTAAPPAEDDDRPPLLLR